MMTKMVFVVTTLGLACAATPALAATTEGEEGVLGAAVPAPRKAFELDLSTGYTQGFGAITSGPGNRVQDIGRGGLGIQLGLNYRADPHLSVGASAQYQELQPAPTQPIGFRARGATVGVQGAFHILPYQRVDPWVSLGTGYRMLWSVPEGPGNNVLTHGFQLAKLQLGLDVRVSRDVAIGPVIGGDLDMFMWQRAEGGAGNLMISDKRVSSYLFAGISARFDVGGTRETEIQPAAVGLR